MNAGWFEVIVGAIGIGLGVAGKLARSSVVIAVGLVLLGLERILTVSWHVAVGDAGALLILFGLGMSIALLLKQRRRK